MACINCKLKKQKCVGAVVCDYCFKHGLDCVRHISKQGQRNDLIRQTKTKTPTRQVDTVGISLHSQVDGGVIVGNHQFKTNSPARQADTVGYSVGTSLHSQVDSGGIVGYPQSNIFQEDDSSSNNAATDDPDSHSHGAFPLVQLLNQEVDGHLNTRLSTYCSGSRSVFTVHNDNELHETIIRHRYKLDQQGPFTLLTCTSISTMPQGCNGAFVVFRDLEKSCSWKFGVVSFIFYLQNDNTLGSAHLYEWSGPLSSPSCPAFLSSTNWEDMDPHFHFGIHDLSSIDLQFVNQVCGTCLKGQTISTATRNEKDGGVQCLVDGPDTLPNTIKVPFVLTPKMNNGALKFSLTPEDTGVEDLYVSTRSPKRSYRRKSKRTKNLNDGVTRNDQRPSREKLLASAWVKPPTKIPNGNHQQLIIVVTHANGESIRQSDSVSMEEKESDMFFIPELSEPNVRTTSIQQFHGILKENYFATLKLMQGKPISQVNNLLRTHSVLHHPLVDCDIIPQLTNEIISFHGYTQVFAGPSSPSVDNTFRRIILTDGSRCINYKFCKARDYHEFVPLSVGLFDSSFHGMRINNRIVTLFNKALGPSGLFGRRKRSAHHNHLTYIGPRDINSESQPSPSEGPNVKGHWLYRCHLSFILWPFVLHVMNYLASCISQVGYYQYRYLSKLLPFAPDDPQRQDFCSIGIQTQNFNCTIHVDKKDAMSNFNQSFLDDLVYLSTSPYLRERQQLEASSALSHVIKWGVGTPTTCGYQCVGDDNTSDVEIIQYFCCRGLGFCYRIRHYWVHLFLAYCFSCYTSVVIFVKDGKAYFGKYPGRTMFAWGKGKNE